MLQKLKIGHIEILSNISRGKKKISSALKVRIRNLEPVGDKKLRMKGLSQPEHSC